VTGVPDHVLWCDHDGSTGRAFFALVRAPGPGEEADWSSTCPLCGRAVRVFRLVEEES
jgi:hypothetical protein